MPLRCRPSSSTAPPCSPPTPGHWSRPWPSASWPWAWRSATPFSSSAIIACLIAAAGWFGQAWREDPSYTAREGERISERLLGPFGLPLLALTLIGIIMISLSRVLLAVSKKGSVVVALVVAVVILSVFFLLSARPRLSRMAFGLLAGVALLALIAAGSAGAASGYRTFENHNTNPPVHQVAKNITYSVKTITVTAGQTARIVFSNDDRGTYHNIAVYTANPGGTPIWTGEPIKGVRTITYTNVFPTAGKYAFRCDFHRHHGRHLQRGQPMNDSETGHRCREPGAAGA